MKTSIHLLSYPAEFDLEWEFFQTKVVEQIKSHFLYSVTFFRKLRRLWDNVEIYIRTGEATDENMAHDALFTPSTQDRKHTLRTCNSYCFSTAKMVSQTDFSGTLYVHCVFGYLEFTCSSIVLHYAFLDSWPLKSRLIKLLFYSRLRSSGMFHFVGW